MKRSLVFTSLVLLSLAFVPSANAQSPAPFIGLWEGIDSENSASQHSITCSDDGTEATCQVTATFSRLTHFCRGGSAHGVGDGGVLEGDELHFVVLDARCENGNDADLELIYKHDLSNDTLMAMLFVNGGGGAPHLPNPQNQRVA